MERSGRPLSSPPSHAAQCNVGPAAAPLSAPAPSPQANTSLPPSLQCIGCPATDIRVAVNDTLLPPFSAIGLVAKEEQLQLNTCVAWPINVPVCSLRPAINGNQSDTVCPIRHAE
jgi:hypothetical protein